MSWGHRDKSASPAVTLTHPAATHAARHALVSSASKMRVRVVRRRRAPGMGVPRSAVWQGLMVPESAPVTDLGSGGGTRRGRPPSRVRVLRWVKGGHAALRSGRSTGGISQLDFIALPPRASSGRADSRCSVRSAIPLCKAAIQQQYASICHCIERATSWTHRKPAGAHRAKQLKAKPVAPDRFGPAGAPAAGRQESARSPQDAVLLARPTVERDCGQVIGARPVPIPRMLVDGSTWPVPHMVGSVRLQLPDDGIATLLHRRRRGGVEAGVALRSVWNSRRLPGFRLICSAGGTAARIRSNPRSLSHSAGYDRPSGSRQIPAAPAHPRLAAGCSGHWESPSRSAARPTGQSMPNRPAPGPRSCLRSDRRGTDRRSRFRCAARCSRRDSGCAVHPSTSCGTVSGNHDRPSNSARSRGSGLNAMRRTKSLSLMIR